MSGITHAFDEAERLKAEHAELQREYIGVSQTNAFAFAELLKAIPAQPTTITDLAQLASLAADRVKELEQENARLRASNEPQADKIYVFDAKAHGHVLRENAELRERMEAMRRLIHAAFQTLLGAIKTRPLALDGIAHIAELAAERIKELEQEKAALREANDFAIYRLRNAIGKRKTSGMTTLPQLTLAAVERIAWLEKEAIRLSTTDDEPTRAELEQENARLRAALARQKERARTGRPHAMQTRTRLSEALAETERNLEVRNVQLIATEDARRELEETLKRGQFAIAQLTQELEYQKHLTRLATAGWKRSDDAVRSAHADFMTLDRKARAILRKADADNAALYEVLKGVEWEGRGDEWFHPTCPECGGLKEHHGHKDDCKLFHALDRWEQTNNPKPQGDKPMPGRTPDYEYQTASEPERSAQADLEAKMKQRLDHILADKQALDEETDPALKGHQNDATTRAPDAPSSRTGSQEAASKPGGHPSPTPDGVERRTAPPYANCPITPETAPAGARILIKDRDQRSAPVYEVTVHEWAPSGKRVLVYNREGRVAWTERLPAFGVLVETLPPSLEHKIARDLAQKMMAHLMGDGAERAEERQAESDAEC